MFVLPCDDVMSQTVGPYQTLPCVDALILDAQPPELPHPHLNPQMTSIVAQVNITAREGAGRLSVRLAGLHRETQALVCLLE